MLIYNNNSVKKTNSVTETFKECTSNQLTVDNIQFLKSLGLKIKIKKIKNKNGRIFEH